MKAKIILPAAVIALAAGLIVLRENRRESPPPETAPAVSSSLPRLVDLGAHSCVPCKMMAPILEELRNQYRGVFTVEFIDVWQNPEAGRQYGIRVIPTQIFYDAAGAEFFRHEGFLGKDDILAVFGRNGIALAGKEKGS